MQSQTDKPDDVTPHQKLQALPVTNQQISDNLQPPKVAAPPVDIKTPAVAEDSDLIEREWVDKAKEIIEKTRSNPYQQQEELALMKAEYLKKRYDREIRSLDDQV